MEYSRFLFFNESRTENAPAIWLARVRQPIREVFINRYDFSIELHMLLAYAPIPGRDPFLAIHHVRLLPAFDKPCVIRCSRFRPGDKLRSVQRKLGIDVFHALAQCRDPFSRINPFRQRT